VQASSSSFSFYCDGVNSGRRAARAASCIGEELTRWEEILLVREEKAEISKKVVVKVSADLDAEWAKAEATRKEYLDKMEAHTACTNNSLSLDNMLGEKKVQLDGREWDPDLREAALVEA
jgi:hypothetical protein